MSTLSCLHNDLPHKVRYTNRDSNELAAPYRDARLAQGKHY